MTRPFALALLLSAALALPALAEKGGQGGPPYKAGHGRGHDNDNDNRSDRGGGRGPAPATGVGRASGHDQTSIVIADQDRVVVRTYYRDQFTAGHCPPGLAKKNNGCLPPGQAKKLWMIGQPLPAAVVYYPLPPDLIGRLTPPPPGYRYVRVASDILMMAEGTRLIAAAVADLGAM